MKQLLEHTADQIISTFVIVFLTYCLVKGSIALWQSPPSLKSVLIILAIGGFLGVIRTIAVVFGMQLPDDKDKGS